MKAIAALNYLMGICSEREMLEEHANQGNTISRRQKLSVVYCSIVFCSTFECRGLKVLI